jgi:hypothetical protein
LIKTITGNISLTEISDYIGIKSTGVGAMLTESAQIIRSTKYWLQSLSRFANNEYTVSDKKQGYWYAESALNAAVIENRVITERMILQIPEYRHSVGEGLYALTKLYGIPEEYALPWVRRQLDNIGNIDVDLGTMPGNLNRIVWLHWSTTANLPGAAKGRPPLQHRRGPTGKQKISPALATAEQIIAFKVGNV